MILYRPVGAAEMALIAQSGYACFPPRLPEQPIFYPVLELAYARQITVEWNVRFNADHKGYVTRFEVDDAFAARYPVQTVGAAQVHRELWVPAEELDVFNRHIIGKIEVIEA